MKIFIFPYHQLPNNPRRVQFYKDAETQLQRSHDKFTSPKDQTRFFFFILVFLRVERTIQFSEKSQTEKRPREIQKLSLFQQPSLNGKLTLLDAAKRKPSTPLPGPLRSWLVPDGSQCTAGPRSGLWLTVEKQDWT